MDGERAAKKPVDCGDDARKFDVSILRKLPSWKERLFDFLLKRWVLRLLRARRPIFRLRRFMLVLRFDDVREVLMHDHVFEVLGQRVQEINGGGHNFLLGMSNLGLSRASVDCGVDQHAPRAGA
jgi:hypothetical protein